MSTENKVSRDVEVVEDREISIRSSMKTGHTVSEVV
jgi:hypothetical protein